MSYRITEANRNHVAVIEDLQFELYTKPDRLSEPILRLFDGDKLNLETILSDYEIRYDRANNDTWLLENRSGAMTQKVQIGWDFELIPNYIGDDYLESFTLRRTNGREEEWNIPLNKIAATTIQQLTVSGVTLLRGTLTAEGAVVINGTLTVNNSTNINGTLGVTQTLDVTGATTLRDNLTVAGISTLGNTSIAPAESNTISLFGRNIQDPRTLPSTGEDVTYVLKATVDSNGVLSDLFWDTDLVFITLTLLDHEDNIIRNFKAIKGTDFEKPVDPIKPGFNFLHWINNENNNIINWPLSAQEDITIKAVYEQITHTIRFLNYNGTDFYITEVADGGNITPPTDNPIREGHTFDAWDFDFTSIITQNETIISKFNIDTFTVTFKINDAEHIVETVNWNETVTKPVDPVVDGYTFKGWLNEDDEEFDFDTPIKEDIILIADLEEIIDDKFFYWGAIEGAENDFGEPEPMNINNFNITNFTKVKAERTQPVAWNVPFEFNWPAILIPIDIGPMEIRNSMNADVAGSFIHQRNEIIDDITYSLRVQNTGGTAGSANFTIVFPNL